MRKKFKQSILLLALVCFSLYTNAQYLGSVGSGFGGVSTLNLNLTLNDSLYNGGQGNGFVALVRPSTNLSLIDSLYNGGMGTGFITLNTNTDLAIQDSLFNGGLGKGDNQLVSVFVRLSQCNDNQLVWNGNSSVFWNNASNWDCGTVPIGTSRVTIPTTATRMPLIATPAISSRINLMPFATINLVGGLSLLTLTGQ